MKNLILMFILFSLNLFGQNINYVNTKDFIDNKNNQLKCDKIIKVENGENELVNTKLFIGKNKDNKKPAKFFNDMIFNLLVKAKYTLKNTSSFKPISINIYENEDEWFTVIKYSGTNDYGGKKDGELSITYDNDLNIVKTFSPIR